MGSPRDTNWEHASIRRGNEPRPRDPQGATLERSIQKEKTTKKNKLKEGQRPHHNKEGGDPSPTNTNCTPGECQTRDPIIPGPAAALETDARCLLWIRRQNTSHPGPARTGQPPPHCIVCTRQRVPWPGSPLGPTQMASNPMPLFPEAAISISKSLPSKRKRKRGHTAKQ